MVTRHFGLLVEVVVRLITVAPEEKVVDLVDHMRVEEMGALDKLTKELLTQVVVPVVVKDQVDLAEEQVVQELCF